MEPITLFSHNIDPDGVLRLLRSKVPSLKVVGPDEDWREVVITFGKGKKRLTLTFNHDPEYYSGSDWALQMNGMQGYLSQFPNSRRKQMALMLPTTFRFSLATVFDPEFDPDGDPRLSILFDVAYSLDAVLFTPSSLRDCEGRIIFGADGEEEEDAAAVWPKVIASIDIPDGLDAVGDLAGSEPPAADRVAKRALAMTAVTARAILEQDIDNPEAEGTYQDLLGWVDVLDIGSELEADELQALNTPLGKMPPQLQLNSTWRIEGLAVIAWALGKFELPPHDEITGLNPLWKSLSLLDVEGARELMANASLRSRTELEKMQQRLFAIHWRCRDYYLNHTGMNFVSFAETCWFGPIDIADIPLVGEDLAIRGKRIDKAEIEEFSATHSAAQERHQAINWICNGPEVYSEASLAT